MAKKKTDENKAVEDLITKMLGQIGNKSPELLDKVLDSFDKRSKGKGFEVLDELIDLHSGKNEEVTKTPEDFIIPAYINFWDRDGLQSSKDCYYEFLDCCSKKKKAQLTKDVNAFLDSVPVYYKVGDDLISTHIWMIASVIIKHRLDDCRKPMLKLLRCEDYVIEDLFMDDEISSINLFAELCHGYLQDLYDIATDDNVMPFARGVAIGAIAKSVNFTTKNTLLIYTLLSQIIETYKSRAKSDRVVSVKLIRATSLIIARMHFQNLLPLIQETYRKLRISGKGIGAISKVEAIMAEDKKILGSDEPIIDYLEGFLEFESMIFDPDLFDEKENDDDYEYDDDTLHYDDENDDDYVDYEEIDDEDDDDDYDNDDDHKLKFPEYKIEDFRSLRIINGKVKIFGEDFVNAHPKGLATDTDRDYIDFANAVCKKITGMARDLKPLDIKCIAMKCALYYEDVIADAGIWRSFIETMRKMYGKPLPFHKVCEERYYADEPNIEDVKLLVWLATLDSHDTGIYNPENDTLMHIAEAIYQLMEDYFETMPINEALYDFFHEVKFVKNFYEARDVVKWAYESSYLSCTTKGLRTLINEANNYRDIFGSQAFYQAESTVIYEERIGPLGLAASEWVAMILESNGRKKEAKNFSEMTAYYDSYNVEDRDGDIFSIRRTDGTSIKMARSNFGDIIKKQLTEDYFFGSLAYYDGEWYLSGICAWDNVLRKEFDSKCEDIKAKKDAGIPNFDKVVKKNNGSQLFYFNNTANMRKFLINSLGMHQEDLNNVPMFSENIDNWTLFLPSKDSPFLFVPDAASVIDDPQNPFFNEKKAEKDYIGTFLGLPYVFVTYLMEHGYLPFAGFRNQHGDEIGRRQLHENYDFLLRCLAADKMKSPLES